MQDVYKNIDVYDPGKKRNILIVFDDIIPDMINNKKLNSIVTELFIRNRKLNISLVFITQSFFKVTKDVRLILLTFLFWKLRIKENFKNYTDHSSDINSKDFIKIYKIYTTEPYSFLANDATLASYNALRFRKNLFNI